MKRTFVGINILPGSTFIQHLRKIKKKLEPEKIRWTSPENFHITLHFFGNTGEEDIETIKHILDETSEQLSTFSFRVQGLGLFTNVNHPRVVWMGLKDTEKLIILRDLFEEQLEQHAFKKEDRPFRPHLTLGRLKKIHDRQNMQGVLEEYRDTIFQEWIVTELIYFESILTVQGAVYQALSRHSLMYI